MNFICKQLDQKILVTGINGDIGSQLRQWLSKTFQEVRCIDKKHVEKKFPNESVETCDLSDNPQSIIRMLRDVDTVLHLAAQSTDTEWESIKKDNIDAMQKLISACASLPKKPRFIFASSAHVNGMEDTLTKVYDTSTTKPDSVYACSKLFGESLAYVYGKKFDVPTIVLRIGSFDLVPHTKRQIDHTWIGLADMCQLIYLACAQQGGYHIWYGISKVKNPWWDQCNLEKHGFFPQNTVNNSNLITDNTVYDYQGGSWASKNGI